MRVSDIVSIDDIKGWNKGDLISIDAPMGSGKSYFVKNILYAFAKDIHNKKILFLVNRKNLHKQFEEEIKNSRKSDTIVIETYQKIQSMALRHKSMDFLDEYLYVICDEFHYFFTDASFNHTTDLSMETILNAKNQIKIFMSATGKFVIDYLEKHKKLQLIKYTMKPDYSYIQKVFFYKDDKTVMKFLTELNQDDKVMYFCRNAEFAYKLSKEFENSLFVCSRNNKRYYKHVDEDKVIDMLLNEKFDEQILFTTQVLDNGVNINDQEVKYIIADIDDFDVLIQCIGRRRIQHKNDSIVVIIKSLNNKRIGGILTQLRGKTEMAELLLTSSAKHLINNFPRQNYGEMIYDVPDPEHEDKVTKRVNEIMYYKYKNDISTYGKIISAENGYEKRILKLLCKRKKDSGILENYFDAFTINDKLDSLVGKKLFKEEQDKLIQWIKENLLTTPKGSHGSIGLKTINNFLEENEYLYKIESKKENSRNGNRGKQYWIIYKLIDKI